MDERDAVDRLREADPAAGAEPDEARLRPAVEARRAQTEEHGTPDAGPHPVPDELAARRSRRLLPAAAAVVAALAVGTAGYAVGRNADPAPPAGQLAVLDAPDQGARLGLAQPEAMAATDLAYGGGGRTSFTSSGLGGRGGVATVWAFDGAGAYGAENAARAAAAFGLEGEPRQEEGGGAWTVGSSDGSGPFLHLMPDGTATVSYHDPELYSVVEDVVPHPLPEPAGPATLSRSGEGTSGSAGGAETGVAEPDAAPAAPEDGEQPVAPDQPTAPEVGTEPTAAPEPGTEPTAAPEPGTGDDVVEPLPALPPAPEDPTVVEPDGQAPEGPAGTVYETLAALGLDPDAAEYELGQHWAGDQVGVVTAHLLVGGERSGTSWYAEVVDGRTLSFSGPLAPVVELGEYDVVAPAQAVERLSDPRFGHSDYRIAAGTLVAPEYGTPWGTPPAAPPGPGAPVPWPVREVTITGAELTLTTTHTQDGVTLLVPAYSLSDSDGGTWTVVALAEHELAF